MFGFWEKDGIWEKDVIWKKSKFLRETADFEKISPKNLNNIEKIKKILKETSLCENFELKREFYENTEFWEEIFIPT